MPEPHTLTSDCWCAPTLVLAHVGSYTVLGLKHNDLEDGISLPFEVPDQPTHFRVDDNPFERREIAVDDEHAVQLHRGMHRSGLRLT